jgi:hypothetical protein
MKTMFWTKSRKILASVFTVCLTGVLAFVTYASLALFLETKDYTGDYPGDVGLRSYFQKGSGTSADPYVISRPLHFYNLTRLQNLGIFSSKTYFSLGYDINNDGKLEFYKSNSGTDTQSYLDMSSYSSVRCVGSEGSPFYGVFEGNNKEIYGLHVQAGPEDVGVFGYIYTGSSVKDLYLNDVTITDNGWDNTVDGLPSVYGMASVGSASYTNSSSVTTTLTTSEQTFTDTTGHFTLTAPSALVLTGLGYKFRSSSEYFTVTDNGDGTASVIANTGADDASIGKYCIANNSVFTSTDGNRLSTRFSVIATYYKDGYTYSHVLATYLVSFTNHIASDLTDTIALSAATDYVNTADPTDSSYTEYSHGVNIGYLIGHCDGSLENAYVFNCTLSLNNDVSGSSYTHKAQESETGLIGEVGPAINNQFTPQYAYENNGDAGVVNFTGLYNNIIGTSTFTSVTDPSTGNYYKFTPAAGTSDNFLKYLRNNHQSGSNFSYVTTATNTLDFAGQKVIQDDKNASGTTTTDRGLGVFSLATSDWDNDSSSGFTNGRGDFAVSLGSAFSEVYYTTSEYYDSNPSANGTTAFATSATSGRWGYAATAAKRISLAATLPTYSDANTWNPDLERNTNYIFRTQLGSDSALNNKDYFANTSNAFLQNYFKYKLIDKNGDSITPGNKDFGVFIKDSNTQAGTTSNITSFTSSLALVNSSIYAYPLTGYATTPARTINFSIKSATGANVTVIAAADGSGANPSTGGFISVYDKSVCYDSSSSAYRANWPSYTTYIPYGSSRDNFDFFDFDYTTGTTATTATSFDSTMSSSATYAPRKTRLFAHTFKIPKAGDYFITSPYGTAKIYYVCAQGQENTGNIGNQSNTYSNINVIASVDFVSCTPKEYTGTDIYSVGDYRLYLDFQANFTNASGDMTVTKTVSDTAATVSKPANLAYLLIWNQKSNPVIFDGTTYTDQYITYTAP